MIEVIPRQWACGGANADFPPLPDGLGKRSWVKHSERELHCVCAVDEDAGWAELIACDSDGSKLVTGTPDGHMDVIRVRVHGEITQGFK
jgi:hypothetical protein